MATYVKFNSFVNQLALRRHFFGAGGNNFKVGLSNVSPAATLTLWSEVTDIGASNGYTAGGAALSNSLTLATSVISCVAVNTTWTGTTAAFGPFRYVVTYNSTSNTGDAGATNLINYWDYGSTVTVGLAETFAVSFGATWWTLG